MEAEKMFWQHVEDDTPPEMSGAKPDSDALKMIFSAGDNSLPEIELVGYANYAREYLAASESIKILEREKDRCAQEIKATLGLCEKGTAGDFKISWITRTKKTFDVAAFQTAHPKMDLDEYYKTTIYRAFNVKENKREG
jgi:predicted phage-related endonuclease